MAAYHDLDARGALAERAREAAERLRECRLCPRACGADRSADERATCGVGRRACVASAHLHFGEESPLVGTGGSGTIFFAGCNLGCCFCQNFDISHETHRSQEATPGQLARVMLDLQRRGAHNINLVTPSHVVAQVLEALPIAIDGGLELPLVYNSGGYDTVETLELLDGVVDIYMPDIKVRAPDVAGRFFGAPDYPEVAAAAVKEMHRQVGDLELDGDGVAVRGLLVRHLVMPEGTAGTREWMRFLADEVSRNTYVNIMGQYHPCGLVLSRPADFPELARPVTASEMDQAFRDADEAGITRLDERRRRAVDLFRLLLGE
jgi:putative pyruvate formate lyase activating enzyme